MNPNLFMNPPGAVFVEPDDRFFLNTGHSKHKKMDSLFRLLLESGNGPNLVAEFVQGMSSSRGVAFSFFFGSAINNRMQDGEARDLDLFVVTQNREFVHQWKDLKGIETRYMTFREMDGHLKRKGMPFLKAPSREYNVLAGIFANGILSLRSSNEMARMVGKVRRELPNRCIQVLSQLVSYDCSKRLTSDTRFGTALNSPSVGKEKSHYRFPGNSRALSAQEARGLIYHSITAKNIQMRWAEPVASCILRGIRIRSPHSVREIRFHMD